MASAGKNSPVPTEVVRAAFAPGTMDTVWHALLPALIDHAPGSPGQKNAWEKGLAQIPQPFRDGFPTLAALNDLARKVWPEAKES